jgi:DNA-directed RNA polymerase subunit M/transcription elongation factor TFIIS
MTQKQLPIVTHPTILLELPISKNKIKYRPFVNKEKKALLLSKDADDWDSTLETLRDVILSCTFGTVDIKTIPVSDAAYLFIQLRIQSIGNVVELGTKCQKCEEPIQLNYNLGDIKVDLSAWNPKLMVTESIGMTFKAPTFDDIKYASGDDANPELFMVSLIDSIFDDVEVYDISGYDKDQLIDWMGQFDDLQMKKIYDHLQTIPTMKQDIKYKCPKCGHEHNIHLEGLSDFF